MTPLAFQPTARVWRAETTQAPVRLARLSELTITDHLAWDALSQAASADSVFAASWFVRSVLTHFDPQQYYRLFIVTGDDGSWDGVLVAARTAQLGRVPLRHLSGLVDANQFLGTPLVRPGAETAFWQRLFQGIDGGDLGCDALRLSEMPEDHRTAQALTTLCMLQERTVATLNRKQRAYWCPKPDEAEDLLRHLPAKRRKRLAALERQLHDRHGPICFDSVNDEAELDIWLSEFLALELAGWKGKRGSALASDARSSLHFRYVAEMGFANGSFRAVVLRAQKRPVAMSCYFVSDDKAFGFKMAYDENFARYAPGIILTRKLMESHGTDTGLIFDSCSAPDAAMINELWPDRRSIADLVIETGDFRNKSLFVAAMTTRKLWHRAKWGQRLAALASPF